MRALHSVAAPRFRHIFQSFKPHTYTGYYIALQESSPGLHSFGTSEKARFRRTVYDAGSPCPRTRSYHRIELQEVHTRNIGEVLIGVVTVTGAVRTLVSATRPNATHSPDDDQRAVITEWLVMTPD